MGELVNVTVGKQTNTYPSGITYGEIAKEFADQYQYDIILAQKDGRLVELAKKIKEDCTIEFLTTEIGRAHV